jgi:hypothetical protein
MPPLHHGKRVVFVKTFLAWMYFFEEEKLKKKLQMLTSASTALRDQPEHWHSASGFPPPA